MIDCFHFSKIRFQWYGEIEQEISGYNWIWHKTDADEFPSVPHLHMKSNDRYVLNVYTGDFHNKNTKRITQRISKKKLKKVWTEDNFVKHLKEKREIYYSQKYDGKRYTELPDYPFSRLGR